MRPGDPIHWLDRAFGVALTPRLMFTEGWGDEALLERLSQPVPTAQAPGRIALSWDPPSRIDNGAVLRRTGSFESPALELLGDEPAIGRASVELLLPADRASTAPVCLYLAASGEQTFFRRRHFALPLVRRGIGALFLENPSYGRRRPRQQRGAFIRTVAEQLAMNRATVREANALLEWLRTEGHWPLGVSGYSMGGHMAILTSIRSRFPIATIPCAAGLSPAPVYLEGLLGRSIRWTALADRGDEARAKARLFGILDQVAGFVSTAPKPEVAIILGATEDGIVLPREVRALKEAWPRAELRWMEGGHVSALLRGQGQMRQAVADAMSRASQAGW